MAQKAGISKPQFSSTAEPRKPVLKELQNAASKQRPFRKKVAKLCFLVSRIPLQTLSGLKWTLIVQVGANLLQQASGWFLAAQP